MNFDVGLRFSALSAASLASLAIMVQLAEAQEHCRLDNPQVTRSAGGGQLKVSVACQQAPSAETVRYPAGTLHLGVTLYKVQPRLRNTPVPVTDEEVEHTYVKPVEITRPTSPREIVVPLGNIGANTHILLAVWNSKKRCNSGDRNPGCTVAGGTLGDTDSFQLPIPVDAWPRPICNVAELTSSGFFRWVQKEGDFGGPRVPDNYAEMLEGNDCFMRFADRPGLGFSVRRWRAQPLPPS